MSKPEQLRRLMVVKHRQVLGHAARGLFHRRAYFWSRPRAAWLKLAAILSLVNDVFPYLAAAALWQWGYDADQCRDAEILATESLAPFIKRQVQKKRPCSASSILSEILLCESGTDYAVIGKHLKSFCLQSSQVVSKTNVMNYMKATTRPGPWSRAGMRWHLLRPHVAKRQECINLLPTTAPSWSHHYRWWYVARFGPAPGSNTQRTWNHVLCLLQLPIVTPQIRSSNLVESFYKLLLCFKILFGSFWPFRL